MNQYNFKSHTFCESYAKKGDINNIIINFHPDSVMRLQSSLQMPTGLPCYYILHRH